MANQNQSAQQCIYCGSKEPPLSDEHIVAAGIGGDQVLKDASCQACSDITSRFEQRVLRQSYGLREVRSALEIGKRRKNEKPKAASVSIEIDGTKSEPEVALSAHPLLLSLTLFDYPTFLTRWPAPTGVLVRGSHRYSAGPDPKDILDQLGADKVSGRTRHYDHDFGKFLAKVAWSGWVAEYGLSSLAEAWLPSLVVGSDPVVGRYVGSLDYAIAGQPDAPCLHSLHFDISEREDYWLATARIQLFVQITPCPTYVACIGRVDDDAARRLKTDGWKLPRQGAIGKPLEAPLPRYIATTIIGTDERAKESDIQKELRALGLGARTSSLQ